MHKWVTQSYLFEIVNKINHLQSVAAAALSLPP